MIGSTDPPRAETVPMYICMYVCRSDRHKHQLILLQLHMELMKLLFNFSTEISQIKNITKV
jgi:hypothetical protein